MVPTETTTADETTPIDEQLAGDSEPMVAVSVWRDELVEKHPDSIATFSDEMLIFWTPVLGPTATLMARQLARLVRNGDTVTFKQSDLAQTFGLGSASGRLNTALERLARFRVVQIHGDHVRVRLAVPPMSVHHQRRLPDYLATAYRHRS